MLVASMFNLESIEEFWTDIYTVKSSTINSLGVFPVARSENVRK